MTTKNKEKGASAVEFALILPLLLIIFFMIIEFSIVMYDKAVITNASREGARRGILMGSPRTTVDEIKSTVSNYCASNLISFSSTPAAPSTAVSAECAASGDYITISVAYPYSFLVLPNFMHSLTGGINLTAVTAMRCE
jgi:Flp pilus assembly protein TadG